VRLPAEWERQKAVLVTFPHEKSDWLPYLEEARAEFVELINNISLFCEAVVLVDSIDSCKKYFSNIKNIRLLEVETNDTWIRDYGAISVEKEGRSDYLDFFFNGWGLKFPSNLDNQVNKKLLKLGFFSNLKTQDMVLEGGSIESNGLGEILTTTTCLLESNRNPHLGLVDIEGRLKNCFGAKKVHFLHSGHLIGDDTDAHIDTLARFATPKDILYVKCYDKNDEHFEALEAMEAELKELRSSGGEPFRLHPLPLPEAMFFEGERLPATYANFLLTNGAVIFPTYGVPSDNEAMSVLKSVFKDIKVVPSSSKIIIRQHGSLHCSSMQIPDFET